ncbi:MAG: polysaccharide deacetylase family protein [Marmoricola sp.]
MNTNGGRSGPVSRRTVLLSVAGVIVGAGELALSIDEHAPRAVSAARLTDATTTRTLVAPVVKTPTSATTTISTGAPPWTGRWNAPIHDLDDYLRRSPGTRFPSRAVMMTVDDGPSPAWTPKYLRLFEKYDVKATFNLIGSQVPSNRSLVRAMASEGHSIANHTWTHDLYLESRTAADIRSELARTNDAIERAAKVRPRIFRAPGGNWGSRIFDEVAREQMMPLGWDIDPRDWSRPGVRAIEDSMFHARPGDIILCHDGGGDRSQTYAALERVIPVLKRRGYHFVRLPGA